MEKLEWLTLIERVKNKERVERPKVRVLVRGKSKKLDRLSRMEAVGGIWEYIDTYYIPPKEEKKVEVKTGNEFWDKVLEKAFGAKRGRPRKEKGEVLPGSRIGDMMQKIGKEYTCSKWFWDDKVIEEDREVPSGIALEVFEAILYGDE